jgi:hypothetical protein
VTDNSARDDLLQQLFGPPAVAAADIHELRAWTHKHTAMSKTAGSIAARELCQATDPDWKYRALTNELIKIDGGKRPRTYGGRVLRAESTMDTIISVAHGVDPRETRRESTKDLETLWPAQQNSFTGWLSSLVDINHFGPNVAAEIRAEQSQLRLPYVHPAIWMTLVWAADSDYTSAVATALIETTPRELWKFATTVDYGEHWFAGMSGFPEEWFDLFPRGQISMYLRSVVCNGWMTSHQIASYMNLPMPRGARSTTESWI